MNLLHEYDNLSASNKLSVLGIDLVRETAEQWDLLRADPFQTQPTRLMCWMVKELWLPVLDHGTLFMGVVNNPGVQKVVYRIPDIFEAEGVLARGYWRPTSVPVPLDSLPGSLEVHVESEYHNIELAWLLVPCPGHQQQFAEMDPKEFLPKIKSQ